MYASSNYNRFLVQSRHTVQGTALTTSIDAVYSFLAGPWQSMPVCSSECVSTTTIIFARLSVWERNSRLGAIYRSGPTPDPFNGR